MSNNYLMRGDTVSIVAEGALHIAHKLPVDIYTVEVVPQQPPVLRRMPELQVPDKLYGDTEEKTKKILNTFKSRSHSTGVLLAGTKGSGKTLLARNIANKLYEEGVPTIIVPFNLISPLLAEFIDTIDTECMVLFDEIDKIPGTEYDDDNAANTNCLLGLFDGISVHKRLYVLTANDVNKINPQLLNRPGRIYYKLLFGGVTQEAIKEYCNLNLNNKENLDKMLHIATMIRDFSFDIMQAIVEECNRYNIEPKEACDMLNVTPELEGSFRIRVFNKHTGKEYESQDSDKYEFMSFDNPVEQTCIAFQDEELLKEKSNEIKDASEREYYKERLTNNDEFMRGQCRRSIRITNTNFTKAENGSLIYEVDNYIVKCTPVCLARNILAF